jgi:Spy/CpxP family protein refolding chaperone
MKLQLIGKRERMRALLAVLVLLAAPSVIPSAPPPPPSGPPAAQGGPGGKDRDDGVRDEEIRETIEIYMLARMKRALDLTREQEEELIPLVQDLSSARQVYRREHRLSMMRLRPLVEDPSSEESEIRAELDRLQESESTFRDEERRTMDRIRSLLSSRQQAQFVLFQERFTQEMQRRLRHMRHLHGEDGGPAGDGPRRRRGREPGGP